MAPHSNKLKILFVLFYLSIVRCRRLSKCTIRGQMTCVFYLPMPEVRVLNCYENYDLKILSILFFTWNKGAPFDGMPLTTTKQWEWNDSFHQLLRIIWNDVVHRPTLTWAISKRGISITSIEGFFHSQFHQFAHQNIPFKVFLVLIITGQWSRIRSHKTSNLNT